jgi:hypothetical protein
VLCLAPRGPHAERHRADHQQDTDERRARRVIGFPNVDASGGNAYADGDEAESHEYVCDRGFHKVSFQRLNSPPGRGADCHDEVVCSTKRVTRRKVDCVGSGLRISKYWGCSLSAYGPCCA